MSLSIAHKTALLQQLETLVAEKVTMATQAIASTKESRDGDTKSSAGDKYETSREMAQQELNRLEGQLGQARGLKAELARINPAKTTTIAELGSLVTTSQGHFFLSVGLGKVEVEGTVYFALSLVSPMGKQLLGCKIGDKIQFNGREWLVEEVV